MKRCQGGYSVITPFELYGIVSGFWRGENHAFNIGHAYSRAIMTDGYQYVDFDSIYTDPATGVLRNKYGIGDEQLLLTTD